MNKETNFLARPFLLILIWIITSWVWVGAVQAASYDCGKASTKVEKLICANPELSKLDDDLQLLWREALTQTSNVAALKADQKMWLKKRNTCTGQDCLKKMYAARLRVLRQVLDERLTLQDQPPKEDIQTPFVGIEKLFGVWKGGGRAAEAIYGTITISKNILSWTGGNKSNPGCKTRFRVVAKESGDTYPDEFESSRHIVKTRKFETYKLRLNPQKCTNRLGFLQFSFPSDIKEYVNVVEYDIDNRPIGNLHFYRQRKQ